MLEPPRFWFQLANSVAHTVSAKYKPGGGFGSLADGDLPEGGMSLSRMAGISPAI